VLRIGYDTGRFDDEWISQLLRDYQKLLEAIALNPQRQIWELREQNIFAQRRKAAKKAISV
jgi:non-ribosomal peptide synthetase component F